MAFSRRFKSRRREPVTGVDADSPLTAVGGRRRRRSRTSRRVGGSRRRSSSRRVGGSRRRSSSRARSFRRRR